MKAFFLLLLLRFILTGGFTCAIGTECGALFADGGGGAGGAGLDRRGDDAERRGVAGGSAHGSRGGGQRKVLLAGVGRESVVETLRLAEFAAREQYDAVLVRTPNFYGPQMTDAAMLNYYRTIADQSALPVVIYSIPKFTHYDISVAVVAELANHRNIIGIKDSSGKLNRFRDWLRLPVGWRNGR